jgi:hypothetical protein
MNRCLIRGECLSNLLTISLLDLSVPWPLDFCEDLVLCLRICFFFTAFAFAAIVMNYTQMPIGQQSKRESPNGFAGVVREST